MQPSRARRSVFVTGGTGYIGQRLIAALVLRGHHVRAMARPDSVHRLPSTCQSVVGDVLDVEQLRVAFRDGETLVQLVGTSHPGPAKAALFRAVDLVSAKASVDAAVSAGVSHLVYVSVAHPAPVMHAYVSVRVEAESHLRASRVPHTVLRPWYVLGPGHQWPHALRPLYALAGLVPAWRDSARRLGLVTVSEMVWALVSSIESGPPSSSAPRVLEVPAIRERARAMRATLEDVTEDVIARQP